LYEKLKLYLKLNTKAALCGVASRFCTAKPELLMSNSFLPDHVDCLLEAFPGLLKILPPWRAVGKTLFNQCHFLAGLGVA